jgi:hypothetical protein
MTTMQAFGRKQIRISKSEIRNNFKSQMLQCSKQRSRPSGFGHLDLDHWILPFDVAQGGEPSRTAHHERNDRSP